MTSEVHAPQATELTASFSPALQWPIVGSALALCLSLGGCHALGPRQVPLDRFDYNTAVANSSNEQMLLNLVRLRYSEVPVFLALNSVLTQYVWTGEVGVNGAGGEATTNF